MYKVIYLLGIILSFFPRTKKRKKKPKLKFTDLVFSKQTISSKEGILLNSCVLLLFLVDSPSGLVIYSFSSEIMGAERPSSTTESGRKTLVYTAPTTATDAAT